MSSKKTLIYNWVEERQCEPFETEKWNSDGTLCTKIHRLGHEGVLSVNAGSCSMETNTTSTASYTPMSVKESAVGKREEGLKRQLYQLAESQVREEMEAPPTFDYTTITKQDYTSDYTPQTKDQSHELKEEPASYWRDNIHQITGVTRRNPASPFARDAKFSTPTELSLNEFDNHN